MGIRHRLAAYDQFLTKYRSWAFLGFTVVLVTLALLTLFTVFGWAWPTTDHLGNVTLADEVTAMLATGTIALAYAALVQATSAERQRQASLLPSIIVGVDLVQHDGTGGVKSIREIDTGRCQGVALAGIPIALRIRSTGPGPAVGVRAQLSIWKENAGADFPKLTGLPRMDSPACNIPAGEFTALAAGDEKFASLNELMTKEGTPIANPAVGTKVAVQLVMQVKWRATVPGWGPDTSAVGLFMSAESTSGNSLPTANWTVMTQRQLQAIPNLPVVPYAEW